jgi:multidrug resistance efflux pump
MEDQSMTAQASTSASSDAAQRPRWRTWLIPVVILIILSVAAVGGFIYLHDLSLYVTTDDADIHSNLTPVVATGAGTLDSWLVQPGAQVVAGEPLGFVKPAPGGAVAAPLQIDAPVDGTVIRIDGQPGQVVGPLQPLAYVADLADLTVWAYVDETQISRIKSGQPVDVTIDATGSVPYHGTVTRVMPATAAEFSLIPAGDRTTANFTKVTQRVIVEISLGNTAGTGLYPGMSASVRIHAPSSGQ